MALEFGDDFSPPCEPIPRIWHKRNDPIGCRPIAVVDLQEVQRRQLAGRVSNCSTHSVEGAAADGNVMSIWKKVCSAHSEQSKVSVTVQDEGGKERGAPGGQQTPNYAPW